MLVLFETAAGFAIYKLLDEKKLLKSENLYEDFKTPEAAEKVVKLKMFDKFKDTTDALASATALIEGKMSKSLKKLMKKVAATEAHEKLAVADAKLGSLIKKKMDIDCVYDSNIAELMRCIRSQASSLLKSKESESELTAMSLGLAHSLSRYKLKFSPDKIDTMIVQAVSLLDDLDKELNNYIMRAREWYGWHFPELGKIVSDNLAYIRIIQKMGMRSSAKKTDLSEVLPEEVEVSVKEAAEISMGTEISDVDLFNIQHLCIQIQEIQDYREQLYSYLKNRMVAIAPNLTVLVGELVGARLISHAGSLINLAKHPASTVQILGAEKALFKALKTKHDTPKYGLIYHAQMVGQVHTSLKGKVSRMLAAKAALSCRVDALSEADGTAGVAELGMEHRLKVESRIRDLEGGTKFKISGTGKQSAKFDKFEPKSEISEYKAAADSTMSVKRSYPDDNGAGGDEKLPKKIKLEDNIEDQGVEEKGDSERKKKKRKKDKEQVKTEDAGETASQDVKPELVGAPNEAEDEEPKKKKKKKKDKKQSDV